MMSRTSIGGIDFFYCILVSYDAIIIYEET